MSLSPTAHEPSEIIDEQDLKEKSDDDSSQSNDDVSDNEELDRYWPPPATESIILIGSPRSKTLTALTFDHAGTRFASGGHDHEVRIWDFQALDIQGPSPIACTQPSGQTIINNLEFSKSGELLLVISGSCQATIVGKDGIVSKEYQCPTGDQYISDMSKTRGHVQMLNDGAWSPKDHESFITCSNDGTVRIWSLTDLKQQKSVIKTRSPITGTKAMPTVCRYSRDALAIVAGCTDGTVMLWDTRRKFISTSICIKAAHLKGSEVTGIDFAYGQSTKICTRSDDESCKIWDTRQPKQPVSSKTGLPTLYSNTDCSFSPDDRFVITGTSQTKSECGGLLVLDANSESLDIKENIKSDGASVIRSRWHPRINHLAFTCSDGSLTVAFDREKSQNGALQAGRSRKRKHWSDMSGQTVAKKIITPHALPLFREATTTKQAYKPELLTGANQGGRVKPAGSTLSSYVARNLAKGGEPEK